LDEIQFLHWISLNVSTIIAQRGCTLGELILAGIECVVKKTEMARPRQRLSLDPPLIRPAGRRIHIADEEAYRLIE
jgi:hypothetical protein